MGTRTTKTGRFALYRHLLEGISKRLSNVTQVTFAGATHPLSDIVKVLQDLVDADNSTAAAKTAAHDAVKAERAKVLAATPLVIAFVAFLRAAYATAADLADFGLVPHKARRAVPLPEGNQALEKRLATRDARHTMGSRQKARIKGVVAPPATSGPAGVTGDSAAARATDGLGPKVG